MLKVFLFFIISLLALPNVQAASPLAGFYIGEIFISISGNVTLPERPTGGVAFTINSDGVITSSGDLTGSVTDVGDITWNQNTTGFTTGKISRGTLSSTTSLNNNGTVTTFRINAKNSGPGIGETNALAGGFVQVNPTQGLRDMNRVKFINNQFVAVGSGGAFATSPDGINWKRVGVPTVLALYDVAYGNGHYVVVGDSSARFWSTNGVDWVANPAAAGPVAAVAFGNGKFVSAHFNGLVSTSTDGVAWTPGPPVTIGGYAGMEFINGEFVAYTGTGLAFSANATEWTSKTANPNVGNLTVSLAIHDKVAFGKGIYIVAGQQGLAISSNLTTWVKGTNSASVAFGNIASVMFANGQFLVCDAADDLWISSNAVQWTRVDRIEFRSMAYGAGRYVGVGNDLAVSSDGRLWTAPVDDQFQSDLHEPAYINPLSESELVATFAEGSAGTFYFGHNGYIFWFKHQFANGSANAPRLTTETLRTAHNLRYGEAPTIVGNKGTMILVDDRSTVLTFKLLPPVTSSDLISGAKNMNTPTLVFVGSQGGIVWSTDRFRTNWVAANSGTTANLKHVAWYQETITGVADMFITVGEGGTLLTSGDGKDWTRRDTGVNVPLVGSAYERFSKRFLAAGADGTLLQSTNGITWTLTTPLPTTRPLYYFQNADTYRENFSILSGGENGAFIGLLLGHDAIRDSGSFSAHNVSNLGYAGMRDAALGNGRFVLAGGRLAAVSLDGRVWTRHTNAFSFEGVAFGKGRFVGAGNNKIAVSGDGLHWQETPGPTAAMTLNGVTYGGGRFVAVGTGSAILISDDGTAWVNKTPANSSVTLNDVAYGNGIFVAGGTGGNTVVSTNGGNNWIEKPTFIREIKGVAFGNGKFVVVAVEGFSAVSTNGVNWESKQYPFISPVESRPGFSEVTFSGGIFYAPTVAGEIYTSADGLNWKRNFSGVAKELRSTIVGNGGLLFLSDNEVYFLNVPDTGSPAITKTPADASAAEGGSLTLSASAVGPNLEFAWLKDGVPISNSARVSGADSATLVIHGVAAADVGHYTFTVSNSSGSRSSGEASVSVVTKAVIASQPQALNATLGNKTTISVNATGAGLSFQWFKNGTPITGATTPDLSFNALSEADAALYYVTISNAAGTVQSASVPISVNSAPAGFSLDPNWPAQPVPFTEPNNVIPQAMEVQPDGKILLGGYFKVNRAGKVLENVIRLNVDGTVDASFTPPPLDDNQGSPGGFRTLANGQVLVMGYFDKAGTLSMKGMARLNNDGSLDATYQAGSSAYNGPIYAKGLADGKLLVSGGFNQLGLVTTVKYIGRLNANGTPDLSFVPTTALNNEVSTFDFQADGSIIVAGKFTLPSSRIARLTPAGVLDSTFNLGGTALGTVAPYVFPQLFKVVVAADGKIYTGGFFGTYNGATTPSLVRLQANGAYDSTFNANLPGAGQSSITDVQLIGNKVLIAGSFKSVAGNTNYANLALLDQNGAITSGLDLASAPNANVRYAFPDPSGGLILYGSFTNIAGQARMKVARLRAVAGSNLPLAIKAQPKSLVVSNGAPASFQVAATGHGTVTYQWLKNGQPIPSQTASSLNIASVAATDAGAYAVQVKDANGMITSDAAQLSLPASGGTTFASWAAGIVFPAGQNGINQDPDGDGYSNGAEFTFGTNPMLASSKPVIDRQVVSIGNTNFPAVRFVRSKSAVGATVDVRASLKVDSLAPAETAVVGTPEDLGNGLERITVRGTVALPSVKAFFFQVRSASN